MSNIEDQIVSMQFDNKQFESGVATSLTTMDKLNQALQFKNAGAGLSEVNRAASGINLNPIAAGIQGINKAWLGMTTIAVTALSNITNKAVDAGLRFAKSFTLDPIAAGFSNYETKINAVQTILANTADQGTNLKQVTGQLDILNTYANKTVYNFAEMAKNIGTFTAAGVDLKTSVSSIKGIANLAALSGSTSEQASSAMYQLSQAIAAGQVHLQDWNSVVNAGIGGAAFQKNLIQTALATGSLDKSQVHLGKTMADTTVNGVAFRQSLTPPPGGTSWLTSKTLTTSLSTFTGDLTVAQLVAKGFQKDVAKSIVAQGKMAKNAATKVKTFSQLFQALKEEVASAYSKVFEALFGNINQAKKFLSPLHTTLENALTKPILAVAAALATWRKAGGFDDILTIFKNLGTIVGNLLYPFKVLFGGLLPSTKGAGKGLESFTKTLANITGVIAKASNGIQRFTVPLMLVHSLFSQILAVVKPLVSAIGKQLVPVFDKVGGAISGYIDKFRVMGTQMLLGLVLGMDPKQIEQHVRDVATSIINWIKDELGIHSPSTVMADVGTNIMEGLAQGIKTGTSALIAALQQVFLGLGKALKWAVENISYSDVLDTINSGLFLGLVYLFKKFVTQFGSITDSFAKVMEGADGVLNQFKNNLKSMQTEVRAKAIMEIAIAVGILALSAILLSKVDGKKLGVSLAAIGGLIVTMVGAMALLGGGGGSKGKHAKVPSPKEMSQRTAQILAMGAAMIEFATAVLILASAVALMGQLDPKTMRQGLEGVAAVIGVIVAATAILGKTGGGKTIFATASAMIVLAFALTAFVGVMKLYEKLDMKTIANGGGKAALVIAAIGLAMRSFGKGAIAGSVGLIIASGALVILAKALQMLAKIGTGDMIKSVLAISFVLGELAATTEAMNPASAGSLLVMAGALIVLAKALQILSKIPFWDLVKALGAITLAILLIAGTSAALSELSPFILALGIALLTVGGALFLAGAGVFLFASALGIIAVVGPAAFQAFADGIQQLLDLLPKIGEAVGGFLVSILTGIVKAAGPLAKAIGKLIGIIIDVLITLIPKGQRLLQRFINACLDVIVHSYGHAAKVIIGFVLVLLTRLDDAVPKFIRRGTTLIIAVLDGLGKAANRIVNAMGRTILAFLDALDKAINKYEPQILQRGAKIAGDLVKGLVQGIHDGFGAIGQAASDLAHHALDTLKNPKNWHINSPSRTARKLAQGFGEGVAMGIADGHSDVEKQTADMANKALDALHATFNNSKKATNGLIDISPKVTPVLDLSQLERDATKIGSTLGHHQISTNVSRRTARSIASDELARHRHAADAAAAGDTYNFEQNIYSPKPVDRVRVYRSTKSQLAFHREVTGKS